MIVARAAVGLVGMVVLATCTMASSADQAPIADTPVPEMPPTDRQAYLPPQEPDTPRGWTLADSAEQGAVLRGVAPQGVFTLSLDGASVPLADDGAFILGFHRDADAQAVLSAVYADGRSESRNITVTPGGWNIQHIDASPTGGVSSAEFRRRRAPELARINAARAQSHDVDGWRQDFIWPVGGRITGVFGSQRLYRGTPGSYHSGIDLAGATGTPFVAPADGVVILAAQDPFTLEGKLLMIDHGNGLNSAFLHCSDIYVREGQHVRQGQYLGEIGSTGRTTGPHLHWGMKLGSARIDPRKIALPAR